MNCAAGVGEIDFEEFRAAMLHETPALAYAVGDKVQSPGIGGVGSNAKTLLKMNGKIKKRSRKNAKNSKTLLKVNGKCEKLSKSQNR